MLRRDFLSLTSATALGVLSSTLAYRPGSGRAEEAVKIGFLLKTMQEERYETDRSLFIDHARAKGAEVLFDSGNNDELLQVQQVEAMLEAGVRVLVLQPVDTGTAGGLIAKAHARRAGDRLRRHAGRHAARSHGDAGQLGRRPPAGRGHGEMADREEGPGRGSGRADRGAAG